MLAGHFNTYTFYNENNNSTHFHMPAERFPDRLLSRPWRRLSIFHGLSAFLVKK